MKQSFFNPEWLSSSKTERWLLISAKLLLLLVLFFFLAASILYGIRVHYEDTFNELVQKTQNIGEHNTRLQLTLSQLKSYKNVESSATQIPYLKDPKFTINVSAQKKVIKPFGKMPSTKQEFPRVYGY